MTGNQEGWNVNEFFEVSDVFNVLCDNYFRSDDWSDDSVVIIECAQPNSAVQAFAQLQSNACVLYGCDPFNLGLLSRFIEVGDTLNVDCNNADPTDEYFSGLEEYECQEASSSVNGEFVSISDEAFYLLGCLFVNNSLELEANGKDEFVFFEIGELFDIDCSIAEFNYLILF